MDKRSDISGLVHSREARSSDFPATLDSVQDFAKQLFVDDQSMSVGKSQ